MIYQLLSIIKVLMTGYLQTREIEREKLNNILTNDLDRYLVSEKIVVLFAINGYSQPYDSTINVYYDQSLNLPEKINDVKIRQIYQLKCHNCLAMAYPYCLCGSVKEDIAQKQSKTLNGWKD